MPNDNTAVLLAANAAVKAGDIEGFLRHCTDDIEWHAIGEPVIHGKQDLREWMRQAYVNPPDFTVTDLVAEGDLVVALGTIATVDADGHRTSKLYSDAWRFRDGRMTQLRAFVIAVADTH